MVHAESAIVGIPCTLQSETLTRAAERVLLRIRDGHPADFERIRRRVLRIAPLSVESEEDRGMWEKEVVTHGCATTDYDEACGTVYLSERVCDRDLEGIAAHEFGHACTCDADYERCGQLGDEWSSELLADFYASKWGFEKNLEQLRENRDYLHHGPIPGTRIEEGGNVFYVSTDYRVVLVGPASVL